jgi:hypothetical protein
MSQRLISNQGGVKPFSREAEIQVVPGGPVPAELRDDLEQGATPTDLESTIYQLELYHCV